MDNILQESSQLWPISINVFIINAFHLDKLTQYRSYIFLDGDINYIYGPFVFLLVFHQVVTNLIVADKYYGILIYLNSEEIISFNQ